jgi:hypothetical protein
MLSGVSPVHAEFRPRYWDVQFTLDNQRTRSHDGSLRPVRVLDDHDVVSALGGHGVPLLLEPGGVEVADRRQHAQAVKEAAVEVGPAQGAQPVARGQGGVDLGGEEVGGEHVGHCEGGDGRGIATGDGRVEGC